MIFINPRPPRNEQDRRQGRVISGVLAFCGIVAMVFAIAIPGNLIGAAAHPLALPIFVFGISLVVIFGVSLLTMKKE